MKTNEFKAWFDGFTEAMDKAPTQKQWARIKERVAEIDGTAITYPVYVARYVPSYPHFGASYVPPTVWTHVSMMNNPTSTVLSSIGGGVSSNTVSIPAFNSCSAMYALGNADAQIIARTA